MILRPASWIAQALVNESHRIAIRSKEYVDCCSVTFLFFYGILIVFIDVVDLLGVFGCKWIQILTPFGSRFGESAVLILKGQEIQMMQKQLAQSFRRLGV